jgi:hypothetical protein
VDDLVASVLGARAVKAAPSEPPPSEIPELRDALEIELEGMAAAAEGSVEAAAPSEPAAELDWWEPSPAEPAAAEPYLASDQPELELGVAEPAGFEEAGGGWGAEPAAEPVRGFLDEPSGAFGEDGISMRDAEIQAAAAQQEAFVAGDVVDVSPPPLDAGDWYEAHTGGAIEPEVEPAEVPEPALERAWATPVVPSRGTTPAAQAAVTGAEPRHLITLGEGDPFGDVVDDQPTPVRQEIEPRVEVPPPAFTSLVRAEDNQLHLRLHGTGAIAESGQVRALDIEVPVPGTWVGNRRVTLQLRLTLSPVAEDDDGGSGRAP